MTENQDVEIVYGRYPSSRAVYSRKYNKIYINEIVKKYPLYLEWIIQHEMSHYNNNRFHKNTLVLLFLDIFCTDWRDVFKIYLFYNSKLNKEEKDSGLEFLNMNFTKEERKQFKDEFLSRFPSKGWLYQKIYDILKPGIDSIYIIIFTPVLYYKNWLTIYNYIIYYILVRIIDYLVVLILRKRSM